MDISTLATQIASLFGLQPSTLILFILIITTAANAGARLIPSDATGFAGTVRTICAFIGVYVSSRVTSGVTIEDVAAAANKTPPIDQRAAAEAGVLKP